MNITKNKDGIMSKESFYKVIDDYKTMFDFTDEMNELFDKYKTDGNIYPPMCTKTVTDLLEFIFNDKNQWISYWIFELDFGKKYEDGLVTQKDGTIIPLKTVEDLYNLLVKNMEENEENSNNEVIK